MFNVTIALYPYHVFLRITEEYIENTTQMERICNLQEGYLVQSDSKSFTQFIYDWKSIMRCYFNYL